MLAHLKAGAWLQHSEMKFSKELIFIVLILAVLIAISVFHKRNTPSDTQQLSEVEYTSYSTEPQGTKAIYLLLEKLGYRPKRLRTPYTSMGSGDLLIILDPKLPPVSRMDADRLLEWLRRGNTVLFAPGNHEDEIASSMTIKIYRGRSLKTAVLSLASTHLTAGIKRLTVRSGNRILIKRADAVQHFGDETGAVVTTITEGSGTAIVLSDPYILSNAGLTEGDNLDLLVNILVSYADAKKTVYFDEYHHGVEKRATVLHLLKGTPLGWAILQVALAVVLLLYSRGRRFGQPKPVFSESHRSSAEYITSLAGIYQTAQASDLVLWHLHEKLLRSVGKIPPSRRTRELIDDLGKKMKDGEISERDLIDLSKRIELARSPREE